MTRLEHSKDELGGWTGEVLEDYFIDLREPNSPAHFCWLSKESKSVKTKLESVLNTQMKSRNGMRYRYERKT